MTMTGTAPVRKLTKMNEAFAEKLRKNVRGEIREHESMAVHTSFGIGGPADIWVNPETFDDLFAVLGFCKVEKVPFLILGRGTNLLVRDGGIEGVVVSLDGACRNLKRDGTLLICGAAVTLNAAAKFAADNGLEGLEFSVGIPGSIGGGLVANAGAWGSSLGDVFRSALVYDVMRERANTVALDNVQFGYRKSTLASHGVILEARFRLTPQETNVINERMKQYLLQRTGSQPVGFKCAGSIFKNPPGGYAGALIDALGFKGHVHGGAMVSDVHANFIVNTGTATANDVLAVIDEIKRHVHLVSGVELEEEIVVVGRP
jgi:UDP-N-acetylmuramate dehydrogenase